MSNENKVPVIVIGAGGHAVVVADALLAAGTPLLGFADISIPVGEEFFNGVKILGDDDIFQHYNPQNVTVAIGIGFMPGSQAHHKICQKMKAMGFTIASIVHPSAIVGRDVRLKEGSQLMAGVIIQPRAVIGENVILNTGARIDHDSIIGDYSHIAPGATICGDVKVGDGCFIGAGATVIQGITIGDKAVIAAGVTVIADVSSGQTYFGGKNV